MLVFIHISETERRTGYTRQHLARLEKIGLFPRRVPISTNRVGHVENEVDGWIAEKIKARDEGTAPTVRDPHDQLQGHLRRAPSPMSKK